MGKLYRRPNSPYWWARWEDADGIPRRKSTKSGDRRVAALFLSAREAEVIRAGAGIPVAQRIALADAVGLYLAAHKHPVWSEDWWSVVSQWWHARLIDDLGGPEAIVSEVTREQAADLPQRWLAGSDETRKVKPTTCNRLLAVGSGFYRWAIGRGMALSNPFVGQRRFHEDRPELPPLSEKQIDAFLAAIEHPTLRRAAIVSVDTGLRRAELQRLRVEDVRGDRLHVASSYERGLTKTKASRVVPLTTRALRAVEAQVGDREAGPVFGRLPDYRHQVAQACLRAEIPRLRWHDLRHLALTRAAHAGALGHDLKHLAGWKSLAMADRYVHPSDQRVADVIARLGQCAPAARTRKPKRVKTRTPDAHKET